MANEDYWTTPRKWKLAKSLIKKGHKNQEVIDILKEKCGSGLSTQHITKFRKELGVPGTYPGPGKLKKKNGKMSKEDILILQGQELDEQIKRVLSTLRDYMATSGIQKLEISVDGQVKVFQLNEYFTRVR